MKQVLLLLIITFGFVKGDMYLHSLRGSNNRLDEANRERNNANRMYDSQNNNRGGYNVGKINLYEGETVPIAWTNQHGCNSDDTKHCEVVVQIMCDPLIRDGTTTERIPTNPAQCRNFNCDLDVRYGRHESYAFYETCQQTERNKGLFTASQKLNADRATRTRQNPGGTRRGYECPEERDYYPYWRPTPWKDIVIFTKDTDKCAEIADESENVKGRWYCQIPEGAELKNGNTRIPITQEKCEDAELLKQSEGNVTTAQWVQAPAHGWEKPACVAAEASRPNHLGLIGHRKQWTYDWTVPEVLGDLKEQQCVMRLRYNITQDYDASLKNPTTGKFDTLNPGEVTAQYNAAKGGNANNSPAELPIWEQYGLTRDDVKCSFRNEQGCNNNNEDGSREYVLVNNPQVGILGDGFEDIKLQLAINTAQYGRTFQDRTHTFMLNKKPAELNNGEKMKLLTVGGKRGNIVQTFPGHEYFFYPEVLRLQKGDYIHLEISGSDTNPNNNDGQGRKGTDRSNICPLKDANYKSGIDFEDNSATGSPGNNYPAYVVDPQDYSIPQIYKGKPREIVDATTGEVTGTEEVRCREPDHYTKPIGGIDPEVAAAMCTGRLKGSENMDYGNMEELDDAGTALTFDPIQVTEVGCWNYVSTRNNNFSNRSQKGKLCVDEGINASKDIGANGGAVSTDGGWIAFKEGSLDTIYSVTFETHASAKSASPTVMINPPELSFNDGESAELGIDYTHRALRTPKVMHKAPGSSKWNEVSDATFTKRDGKTVAIFSITQAGEYKVDDSAHVGAVAAIIVIGIVFTCVLGALGYFKWKTPSESQENFNTGLQNT